MNKENSIENEMSTEIGDTLKSYSSKFRNLKSMRTQKISPHLLPVRLEKAALTIQRFWRRTLILRQRLYHSLRSQLDNQTALLRFENRALANITSVYHADCTARKQLLSSRAQSQAKEKQSQCSVIIKRLVGVTLQMEKRKVPNEDLDGLEKERAFWKRRVNELEQQKGALQELISQQLQEEEAEFMRVLKEQKLLLLQASKRRGELEKEVRERLVEACRQEITS